MLETNEYVKKTQPVASTPKIVEPEPVDKKIVPDWVQEFNEETLSPPEVEIEPEEVVPTEPFRLNQSRVVEPGHQLRPVEVVEEEEIETEKVQEDVVLKETLNDISPMPNGLRTKLRKRMGKIRASWIVLLIAVIVVQQDDGSIAQAARTWLQ